MRRPEPKKNARCMGCLETKPLLMPVGGAPGFPFIAWDLFCLDCRVNAESDKTGRCYYELAWEIEHSKRPRHREAYPHYLAAEPF